MSTPVRYFGKYELRESLGQGRMADVWKAFDPQLKRFVAIKYLHANMLHTWLEAVKKDAITLLNDQQLNQANTLATFNNLADNAEYANSGQVDPITLQVQHNGVVQIYDEIQRLATFQLNKAG